MSRDKDGNYVNEKGVTNKISEYEGGKNIDINTPDYIYLNFFQHLGIEYSDLQGDYENLLISKYVREYIN